MKTPILSRGYFPTGIISFPFQEKEATKKAFTLVELIVVITILAILWTIAFISLQWYSRDARDSTRTSDLWNMKTSLELYTLKTWKYPKPDNFSTITYSGWVVWYQWIVWDQVTTNLKSLNEKPLDPLINTPYIYSTTQSYSEYEVLALYEWSVAYNPIINQTNAATSTLTPKVVWNYNWVFVQIPWYIIPTPSIIIAEPLLTWTPLPLTSSNIKSLVITNGTNIPNNTLTSTKTWALTGLQLAVFTWSITKTSTNVDKVNLIKKIQLAYSSANSYNNAASILLDKNINLELVNLVNTLVKTPLSEPFWDWRDLDPNCSLPDVQIGAQVWAWCNSTVWNWFEFGQTDSNIWTSNYSWTVWSCYDYDWNPTGTCTPWDITMVSNTKANTWFTWTNANWDSAINNIWWKLYTWTSLDTNSDNLINSSDTNLVCWIWYHIPSDTEWSTAENTLFWSTCDTWLNVWNCVWVGWKNHSTNSITSIVSKLWIPLAGRRNSDGATFILRGYSTILWSSTSSASSAYHRFFRWQASTVNRDNNDNKLIGFSVRCLKD